MTSTKRGRPRSFDREAALRQATLLFWRHGYEGTSVADLTAAMGISPPSLYAAFGDKRTLFDEVVERYGDSFGAFLYQALDRESDPRAGFARMLDEAAVSYTAPDRPAGCLIISAAVNCSPRTSDVEQDLRARRVANVRSFEERLLWARDRGALAEGTDVRALAVYFAAVIQGMSQQARDGATTEELRRTAAYAMSAWPEPHT
ncbi:TetR/AcrR family transcriptional regulator [Streptomyces sp. SID9913]|uniref:TetR/AcrR family transcriptional regulator n=1 Tax=unclassified Streptomyces TaxID=2593676 RepID=UPI0013C21C12|nr:MULTISPECIES: TetR/AcrR family transcriptional regulator [unclassified Streptomyces]NEC31008.1 TetR/AcrR family transcriptional regulator [Streptomyces sp. SID8111]NED19112.1 TetR/AcrR family transcriptional regulator [Streptomyces sp. SID9913]NED19857.1 TetR/AcrR family transcriptional regulator [Streptomyces sp. SID9913]